MHSKTVKLFNKLYNVKYIHKSYISSVFQLCLNLMSRTGGNKYVKKTNEIGIACRVLSWESFEVEQML